jgi:hypothetical protein
MGSGPVGMAIGTSNGGATWTNQNLPGGLEGLGRIVCRVSPMACFATGDSSHNGLILVYR